jgi:hypothetical protein
MGTEQKRQRGRPKKDPSEVKRHNVTIAMADPIRRAIGEAAERNGRSISSEIDFRLGLSLALEQDAGNIHTRGLIDLVRLAASQVEAHFGHAWPETVESASALAGAIDLYVRANSPRMTQEEDLGSNHELFEVLAKRLNDWQASAKSGEKPSSRELLEIMTGLYSAMGQREVIMSAERKRRLVGAQLIAEIARSVAGEEVDPLIAQGGWSLPKLDAGE